MSSADEIAAREWAYRCALDHAIAYVQNRPGEPMPSGQQIAHATTQMIEWRNTGRWPTQPAPPPPGSRYGWPQPGQVFCVEGDERNPPGTIYQLDRHDGDCIEAHVLGGDEHDICTFDMTSGGAFRIRPVHEGDQ